MCNLILRCALMYKTALISHWDECSILLLVNCQILFGCVFAADCVVCLLFFSVCQFDMCGECCYSVYQSV